MHQSSGEFSIGIESRQRILRWCESRSVGYVLGLPANRRVAALAKVEHSVLGLNTRFVVTNLKVGDGPLVPSG